MLLIEERLEIQLQAECAEPSQGQEGIPCHIATETGRGSTGCAKPASPDD